MMKLTGWVMVKAQFPVIDEKICKGGDEMNISRVSYVSGIYSRRTSDSHREKSSGIKTDTTMETSKKGSAETKNDTCLPDKVVEEIQRMAKEDAKKEIYMGKEFGEYRQSTMRQNVSPNRTRAALMIRLKSLIANPRYTNGRPRFFKLLGCTVEHSVGIGLDTFLSIYDSNGEMILHYGPNAGWRSHQTKAESLWMSDTGAVYAEAYDAARAEIKAQEAKQAGSSGEDAQAAKAAGFSATV